MKNFSYRYIFSGLLLLVLFVSACKKEDEPENFSGIRFSSTGTLVLNMGHYFNGQLLQYAPIKYYTAGQDTVSITQLTYYLSNVTLEDESGQKTNLGNYNLVNEDDPVSKIVTLSNVPAGTYKKISFRVGVDSVRNHTGAQEGALDPSYGMFWTWNTGYIFFRVKGRHGADGKSFTYDIGGDQNRIQATSDLSTYKVEGSAINISYRLELAELFKNPYTVHLKTDVNDIHSATEPTLLPKLVQNAADLFTVSAVQ